MLSTRDQNYVLNYNTAKEMWDTFKKIYEVPTKMKREIMNTVGQVVKTPSENEENLHRWFSGIKKSSHWFQKSHV